MKILVIGGTGIIGTGIVEAAVSCGHEVIALSRQKKPIHDESLPVKYLQLDWNDESVAKKALENMDVDVIIDGLVFKLDQLIRDLKIVTGHCKQYIYISTAGVYEQPVTMAQEDAAKSLDKLIWSYSVNKRKAEIYLEQHNKEYPFMITTVRPPFTYGDTRIPCAMVGRENPWTLPYRILEGKPIVFIKDGENMHAITHISTFANAVVGLFLNPDADMEFFHICDDKAYTWEEVINTVGELLGVAPQIVHVPIEALKKMNKQLYAEIKYNKMKELTLSNQKIKKVVPDVCYKVELKDGLKRTVEHLQAEYAKRDIDTKFDAICDVLLLGYSKYDLPTDEYDIAQRYVEKLAEEEKKQLKQYAKRLKKQNFIKQMKHYVKSVIEGLFQRKK